MSPRAGRTWGRQCPPERAPGTIQELEQGEGALLLLGLSDTVTVAHKRGAFLAVKGKEALLKMSCTEVPMIKTREEMFLLLPLLRELWATSLAYLDL